MRQATGGGQAQFIRPCRHPLPDGGLLHPDDHAGVFLDVFVMDHRIDLRQRLDIERYTVSLSDVLLTKLQLYNSDQRDLRDIITILKDHPLGDTDAPGVVNTAYTAGLCADDWGLHHDVVRNLDGARELLPRLDLTDEERERTLAAAHRVGEALKQAPKTRRWRRRARAGTRRPWHNEVEERDGHSA